MQRQLGYYATARMRAAVDFDKILLSTAPPGRWLSSWHFGKVIAPHSKGRCVEMGKSCNQFFSRHMDIQCHSALAHQYFVFTVFHSR